MLASTVSHLLLGRRSLSKCEFDKMHCENGLNNFIIYLIKSLSIGDGLFWSDWIKLSTNEKRNLLTIIHRTQKPPILKAFGFFNFNLPTFANVRHYLENMSVLTLL